MNVFEHKPLNLAHAYERKAKKCLKTKDYEAAITHYHEACIHLAKAMDQTYSVNCYLILRLQYDNYADLKLRCQSLMSQKLEPIVEYNDKLRTESMPLSKETCTECSDPLNVVETDHPFLMPEREPDSLLQFLNPSPKLAKNSQKLPKTKDDIIEELQIANQDLKREVTNRLRNEDTLISRNTQLEKQVRELELQVKELQSQVNGNAQHCEDLNQDIIPQSFTFDESHFRNIEC